VDGVTTRRAALASRNAHKLGELRAALPGWEVELLEAGDYPPEDADSYVENARVKARHGRQTAAADAWVLGEDSGLEVAGLGGAPGIRSARWHGDADPVNALLDRLAGVEGDGRSARYVCELVALAAEGTEVRGTGVLPGRIAEGPAGSEGFGYDPIFVPQGETRTVAVLGNEWKRAHSHRARAARALLSALASELDPVS
jgi:XTP/dITP diphosphohydrolase